MGSTHGHQRGDLLTVSGENYMTVDNRHAAHGSVEVTRGRRTGVGSSHSIVFGTVAGGPNTAHMTDVAAHHGFGPVGVAGGDQIEQFGMFMR